MVSVHVEENAYCTGLSLAYVRISPNLAEFLSSSCQCTFFRMQCQMPSFRWPDVANDISLAKEVISRRPDKPSDWESIACTLSELFSTEEKPVALKGRGCRERMELLTKKYREEDNKSLKRYLRSCLV